MILSRVQGPGPTPAPLPSFSTQVCCIPRGGGRGACSPGSPSAQRTLFHPNPTDVFLWMCVSPLPALLASNAHPDKHSHSRREVGSEGTFNPPANSFTSRHRKTSRQRQETLFSFTEARANVLTFCCLFTPSH